MENSHSYFRILLNNHPLEQGYFSIQEGATVADPDIFKRGFPTSDKGQFQSCGPIQMHLS